MDLPITESTIDLSAVRYEAKSGLVPVVVQDAATGGVLMLAYADREALKRTLATKTAWFYSRSRQEYWQKGATSGNLQHVVDVRMDCDGDAILYLVNPDGPACHTGKTSCFYRSLSHEETSQAEVDGASASSQQVETMALQTRTANGTPESIPAPSDDDLQAFRQLWNLIDERYLERPEGSYTTYLFEHGAEKIGKKVGEEAVEVALAALKSEILQRETSVASESADLLYHLLVLWRSMGLSPSSVFEALAKR